MEKIVATLKSHVAEHDLVKRAEEGFYDWVDAPREEGASDLLAGCSHDQLHARLESINLCFHPENVTYPYVDTRLSILRREAQVGYYRRITHLDGVAADDYFVLADAQHDTGDDRQPEVVQPTWRSFYRDFAAAYGTCWLALLGAAVLAQTHIDLGTFGMFCFLLVGLVYAFIRRS